jgi:endonuclease/exonuclease/phosphatase family metal-dependent hydrolase
VWIPKFQASYPKGFREPPSYYRNAPSDGSAIFVKRSKFKLGKTVTKRFQDLTGNDGMTQVIATAEVLEKSSGKHVLTASTSHLKAGGHFQMRLDQGKAWVEFLQKEGFRAPFVLTGDFNEDRHGHPNGGVNHLMNALALHDSYDVGLGKPPAFTCRWGTFDYVLASEQLRPRKLWSIPADRSQLPSRCYPSDHLALAVELV